MVLLCVSVIALLLFWRIHRDTPLPALIQRFPEGNSALVHVDVAALREAGLLDLIAGTPDQEEAAYRKFVADSGFNYRTDLDAIIAAIYENETFLFLRGRFDWGRLNRYVKERNGSTYNGFCRVRGSQPDRQISFFALTPSIMALASSRDSWAATALQRRHSSRKSVEIPDAPVWMETTGAHLSTSPWLPAGARAFVSPLTEAGRIILSAGPAETGFAIHLEAQCGTPATAARLATKLEAVTQLLGNLIRREGKTPSEQDLSGVLTAGTFQWEGTIVRGRWPLPTAFLKTLAANAP